MIFPKRSIPLCGVALAFAFTLVAAPRPARAFCGFYVSGAGGEIFNDATQVVLMRFGTLTVMSIQNAYKGPPESFAMVVPVPTVLQEDNVKTLDRSVFKTVDQLASPRLVEYWEQDPCPRYPPPMSAPRPRPGMATKSAAESADAADRDLGVTVEAQFKVGEYEIVILSARDSGGLDTWLRREKYQIPEGAEPYFRPYVASGSKFFVAKVDVSKVKLEAGRAILSPLRFHYDSEVFALPIRLGMMNSAGTQDLVVHILAPNQRYEVANYPNVTIPTNLVVQEAVKEDFGGFYNALFDYTVRENPGAVVTEYSWPSWPGKCDPCPGAVSGLNPSTLEVLGGDAIARMISDVDLEAAQTEMSRLQQELARARQAGAPTAELARRYQQTAQRLYSARGRVQQVMSSFVLTRLHARYAKGQMSDDLVFSAAAPIIGGRGMPDATGALQERTQPASTNQFQGRYVILHRWKGAADCANPSWGRWGGPPGGPMPVAISPPPAAELAIAERGAVEDLPKLVGGTLPEFEYRSNTGARAGLPPRQPSPRGCGCQTAGGAGIGAMILALAVLGLRRRRLLARPGGAAGSAGAAQDPRR